jgi:hypothetical protein
MDLQQRVVLLKKLGVFILSGDEKWEAIKRKASHDNAWFIPEFIDYQLRHLATSFLSEDGLRRWIQSYAVPDQQIHPKTVGLIMAGNIPLAGFHDFMAVFISGHNQTIKASAKDAVLIDGIVSKLIEWEPACASCISFSVMLKNRDAYIATGSNNSGRYFDYYFSKYPHIIRRNRTSAAILTGNETALDLDNLADDVYLYFGLGCRNVTKIYIPENYDFIPLLEAFRKYNILSDNHKYKNNYDYQLAILIINKLYYMTNGSVLLQENRSLFSPISQLHYEYYTSFHEVEQELKNSADIQCIVSKNDIPFGQAQQPGPEDYADKADTLKFLLEL